jgi:hypothetical protein
LQKLGRCRIEENVVVDVPKLSYASSFGIIKDQGKGDNVPNDDPCFKIAASEVELSVIFASISKAELLLGSIKKIQLNLPVPITLQTVNKMFRMSPQPRRSRAASCSGFSDCKRHTAGVFPAG